MVDWLSGYDCRGRIHLRPVQDVWGEARSELCYCRLDTIVCKVRVGFAFMEVHLETALYFVDF